MPPPSWGRMSSRFAVQFGTHFPKECFGTLQLSQSCYFILLTKLQVTACGVMKASMLHDKTIGVRTSPPSTTHMGAYMAAVNGDPSGTQPPPLEGEEEPHYSPSNPHLGGRTHNNCKQTLGDLTDNELERPPTTPWGNPVGNGDPNVDTWAVIFLRGGQWVPPEQPLQPPAPAQPDGGRIPEDNLLIPQCPFNAMRMWGT